ncbi:MAG TPA: carbohydrate ABC transporter permease, partial [Salinisphaera sp.]|nr:carbohydrate ABC transporter permease [Salinisphaera sp.]
TGARIKRAVYYASLWAIALMFFLPVLWIVLSSLKSADQMLSSVPTVFFSPTFENIVHALYRPEFIPALINSVILSVVSVVLAVVVAFAAAYSISRFKPKGSDFLMFLLLSMRMVPAAAVIIPLFLMFVQFHWKGSYVGLILFYTMYSIPFSLWILKGFLDGVSQRFDETALICGANHLQIMFGIILPQVRPALIAAFIFNVIFVWNEFLVNYIVGGSSTQNIPGLLATGMYSGGSVDWTFMAATTTIYMIPVIVMIFFFQKYLLVGMTFGTVRGEV